MNLANDSDLIRKGRLLSASRVDTSLGSASPLVEAVLCSWASSPKPSWLPTPFQFTTQKVQRTSQEHRFFLLSVRLRVGVWLPVARSSSFSSPCSIFWFCFLSF